ncbi:MAG TPA: GvpL/GvpF family gas vesicle protein [Gemmatimonadaceae bacterium]|nr:GvpL/GvpF family gas vesicle protein [Gemmatimonadaceae bacterium]
MARMALSAQQLFGVAFVREGAAEPLIVPDVTTLRFRDLAALVRPAPYARLACAEDALALYRRVVDAAFLHGAVLPAPCGTVFRSADQVRLWMEQNYIALHEGINFVSGRCETRVHAGVSPLAAADAKPPELAAAAAESFRILRRHAVAALPVRRDEGAEVLSAAFLIEQDGWADFAEQVREEGARHPALRLEQTGPWPPYDFVRVDFGV